MTGYSVHAPGGEGSHWDASPFRLWSLWEMLAFNAGFFCSNSTHLQRLMDDVAQAIRERGVDALITADEGERTRSVVNMFVSDSERLLLIRTVERIGRISNLQFDSLTLQALSIQLEELQHAIWRDLYERTFMYMPRDKEEYFDKPELFGEAVRQRFPKAAEDITAAGNCFATGNYTACVFHLMRVLEHGLRALAKKLRISFKTKQGATVPIDLQEWGTIIGKIEAEISDMKNLPKGKRKSEELEFYSQTANEFRYFKDAWRNHVMHTRTSYDEHDAAKAMEHVRSFMQHVATKVKG